MARDRNHRFAAPAGVLTGQGICAADDRWPPDNAKSGPGRHSELTPVSLTAASLHNAPPVDQPKALHATVVTCLQCIPTTASSNCQHLKNRDPKRRAKLSDIP